MKAKVNCGRCQICPDDRRIDGQEVDVVGQNEIDPDTSDVMAGGEARSCPSSNLIPASVGPIISIDDDEQDDDDPDYADDEEIEEPEAVDYGYGPACSRCRATAGECHGKGCPAAGQVFGISEE